MTNKFSGSNFIPQLENNPIFILLALSIFSTRIFCDTNLSCF